MVHEHPTAAWTLLVNVTVLLYTTGGMQAVSRRAAESWHNFSNKRTVLAGVLLRTGLRYKQNATRRRLSAGANQSPKNRFLDEKKNNLYAKKLLKRVTYLQKDVTLHSRFTTVSKPF